MKQTKKKSSISSPVTLKRSLSLPALVLYGLGTTIGAGIYALVGELAKVSGYMAPASFLLAAAMAALTAISYAELSARYPRAAGAAVYVSEGLKSNQISSIVGMLVISAGLVSSAALVNGFTGYLDQMFELERHISIGIVVLVLCAIAMWGISESVVMASIITVIEVGGLLLIIGVSYSEFGALPQKIMLLTPSANTASFISIGSGALLAFYAFIGFEDMVVVAEEVKDVKTTLPAAILLSLGITTVLYMAIMIVAVLGLPLDKLSQSQAPMVLIYEHFTGQNGHLIGIIGMLAIINGALIQIIMAARVIYGLACRGQLPVILASVNAFTRTPLVATAIAAMIVLGLALLGTLGGLAESTSIIMLVVFALVNLSLLRVKLKEPEPEGIMVFPIWIPVLAFIVCIAMVIYELSKVLPGVL